MNDPTQFEQTLVVVQNGWGHFMPELLALQGCELVKKLKPKKVYVNFIIELKDLNGKSVFGDDVEVESVLTL